MFSLNLNFSSRFQNFSHTYAIRLFPIILVYIKEKIENLFILKMKPGKSSRNETWKFKKLRGER